MWYMGLKKGPLHGYVCARCLLFRVFLTPLRFSWGDVLLDAMAGHNPLDMDHTLCCDSKLFSVQFG